MANETIANRSEVVWVQLDSRVPGIRERWRDLCKLGDAGPLRAGAESG